MDHRAGAVAVAERAEADSRNYTMGLYDWQKSELALRQELAGMEKAA